jgi:hypothetical protein
VEVKVDRDIACSDADLKACVYALGPGPREAGMGGKTFSSQKKCEGHRRSSRDTRSTSTSSVRWCW